MKSTAVEQIKERLSIVDVVGSYVELTRAGKNYKAKSPFTNEKTPSFYVSPDRGMYYCFSSQRGGDMFTFVQEMEGVDFKGALKILAERAHVELVPEDPKKRDERETQYALLEEATQYFFKEREDKPEVRAYIADRGVNTQTVHAWRIGYAKDEWRALKQYMESKGFSEEQMIRAGLIKKADQGKESYDVFRDRIMFPIFDSSGRVVAFSGRTMKKEDGIPKYVNSPETELFQKSEILYGYDKAKQGIRHFDFSLLVEGQFDLVLAHQAGYTNTVAVSGTAFTTHHLALLERLSSRIVLALDSDRAGVTAVKRIAGIMLQHGMDVKVAQMEGGKDPADIIKANPLDFKHFVGNAVHVIEFVLGVLKEGMKDERTYKLRVREELIPLLVHMPNRIDREHFEQVVADAIGTTKDAIHYEVGRLEENEKQQATVHREVPASKTVASEKSPQRRMTLESRLYALSHACIGERAWIASEIRSHVERLMKLTPKNSHFWIRNQRRHECPCIYH
jgi:DNA primase